VDDIDAHIDEYLDQIDPYALCRTCKAIKADKRVGAYVGRGSERHMSNKQIRDVVALRCKVSLTEDSLRNHLTKDHPNER
jgi:hypothetical protein